LVAHIMRTRMTASESLIARKGSRAILDAARFGAKAAGLAQLDSKWTPRFFALEVGSHTRLKRDKICVT
jgi:hypothetical protein